MLDTSEGLLKGGIDGAVIVPGDPEKSMLIESIRYLNKDLQMPPKVKLSDAQIADLVSWVKMGAPDPRRSESSSDSKKFGYDVAAARQQWAFRLPNDPPVPKIKNTAWPQSSIDN